MKILPITKKIFQLYNKFKNRLLYVKIDNPNLSNKKHTTLYYQHRQTARFFNSTKNEG